MTLYVGARDPEAYQLVLKNASFDFSEVIDTDITVRLPNGDRVNWATWSRSPGAGQITLTHLFAPDGSDVPMPGRYRITGWLITAAGRRRIAPVLTEPFENYD